MSDVEIIRQHIAKLDKALDSELPYLMRECKQAIKDNEDACALLLPEDIGELVAALKRMNADKLAELNKKKKAPAKKRVAPANKKILKNASTEDLLDALGYL